MKYIKKTILYVVCCALVLSGIASAQAETLDYYWTGAASNTYWATGNWNVGSAGGPVAETGLDDPTNSITAHFLDSNGGTANFDYSRLGNAVKALIIGGGSTSAAIARTGGTLTVEANKTIDVKERGTFTTTQALTINSAGKFSVSGGTASTTGSGLFVDGSLDVSKGTFTFNNGGNQIQVSGGIHVSGGSLNIQSANSLRIGNAANATMSITGGEVVVDAPAYIGVSANTGTINQSGGKATFNWPLNLGWGNGAVGEYNLTGGTLTTTSDAGLWTGNPSGISTFTVNGGTANFNKTGESFTVGLGGTNELANVFTLTSGTVNVADTFAVKYGGVLNVAGGEFNAKTVTVDSPSSFNMTNGTACIESIDMNGGTFIQEGGILKDARSLTGSYAQNSGAMFVPNGTLAVSNVATVNGIIDMSTYSNYVGEYGETLSLISANSASGAPTFLNVPPEWTAAVTGTGVIATYAGGEGCYYWTGASNNTYYTGKNWKVNGTPYTETYLDSTSNPSFTKNCFILTTNGTVTVDYSTLGVASLTVGNGAGGELGTATLNRGGGLDVLTVLKVNKGAEMTVGGAVTISGRNNVPGLMTVDGGTFNANNTTTVSSELDVSAGTYNAAGAVTVNNGGTVMIDGGTFQYTSSSNFVNNGEITLDSGSFVIAPGSGSFRVGGANHEACFEVKGGKATFASPVYIGTSSNGTFAQSGGETEFNNVLELGYGNFTGNFDLSGGTLTANDAAGLWNGNASGPSTFNVSGGTANFKKEGESFTIGLGGTNALANVFSLTSGTVNAADTFAVKYGGALKVGETGQDNGVLNAKKLSIDTGAVLVLSSGTINPGEGGIVSGDLNCAIGLFGGTFGAPNASWSTELNATVNENSTVSFAPSEGQTIRWNGSLSGAGNVVIAGEGVVTLAGSNSYTGTTTVKANAALNLPGTVGGDLLVEEDAVFTGNGTVAGNLTINGKMKVDLDSLGDTAKLNVEGTVSGSGTIEFTATNPLTYLNTKTVFMTSTDTPETISAMYAFPEPGDDYIWLYGKDKGSFWVGVYEKSNLPIIAPTGATATYGQTLADVELTNPDSNPAGTWAWAVDTSTSVGDVGDNTFKANFTPTDAEHYSSANDVDVVVTVEKADPVAVAPKVTAAYGQTLADVALANPAGNTEGTWTWEDDGTTSVGQVGETKTFLATFTPTDTGNYNIKENVEVTFTVAAAASVLANVTANNRTYDGTEKPLVTVDESTLAGGKMQYATGTATEATESYSAAIPAKTDAGTYYVWYKVKGDDNHTDSDEDFRKVEIGKAEVTITAQDHAFTYNGTAQAWPEYDAEGLIGDDTVTAVVTGSITFPSESLVVNKLESYTFTKGNAANYSVTTVDGTLTMKNAQAPITITAGDGEWTYDGTAHTNPAVTVTKGELFSGDELVATAAGSVVHATDTKEGNNPVKADYKILHGDEDVTANYVITAVAGTLTMNRKSLIITADSGTKTYDGTALTKDTWTNTALAEGDVIESVTMAGSQTEVGSSDNMPSAAKIVNAAGEDVTASYQIEYKAGTLQVTQNQAVIITADSDTKTYDGTPLTKNSWQVTGLAEGDTLESVTMTGSQTAAGKSNNVPSAAKIVNAAGEDVTGNYEITYSDGILSVTPKSVTITAEAKSKVFGEADPELTAKVSGAVGDEKLNYTLAREKGEDAGEYAITVTVGENPNYEVAVAGSILTIAKADSAVITAPKAVAELVEDGTAQELVTAGTATGGEMQYAVGTDDKTVPTEGWSNKVPTGTNAGVYYVWYKVAGDANHNDTEAACVKAEIEKATEPEPEPVDLIEQFVARCYLLILDREPEAGGLAYWTKQLKTGESSVSEMLQSFVSSKEFRERNFSDKETLEILLNAMDANETDRAKWTAELEKGTPLLTIINGLGASNEFKQVREDHDIDSDYGNEYGKRININKVRAMVARCYRVFLGREAEDAGMNYWAELLSSGKRTAVNTILGFLTSKEYTALKKSNGEIVDALYQTMLNRAAEAEGKAAWTAMLDAGEPVEKVINGIAESNEFKAICKNLGIRAGKLWVAGEEQPTGDEGENPEQKDPEDKAPEEKWDEDKIQAFVARCYRKGLGRDPETEGLENWTNLIVRGKSTPVKAVKAILTSEEAKKLNLSDEAFVNALYGIFLNRSADETGMAGWVDKLESGTTRESLISSFAKTEEVQKALEKMKIKE